MPTPTETEQIREIKQENIQLRAQIIGSLEVLLQMHQTTVESLQSQLDRERTIVRLLVRKDAGVITPEEEVQLQELRHVGQEAMSKQYGLSLTPIPTYSYE